MNKTIEEKAKAYDEAVERAKRMFSKKEINYLFPELAESEDEKVRKEILEVAKTVVSCDGTLYGKKYNCREWIAWLEKQGKPNKEYWRGYKDGKKAILDKYSELKKPTEWSKEDIDIIEGMIIDYRGEIERLSNSIIDEQAKPIYQERIDFLNRLKTCCPELYNVQKKIDNAIYLIEHYTTHGHDKNLRNKVIDELEYAKRELEKQGEKKPIDKIQLGKKYKCIASPRYSTFRRGNIYKPVDNFLCNLMNLCYECFEPIEDSEQKPTDEDMKEALRTEYEKGRADAIAEMEKPTWSVEDMSKVQRICKYLDEAKKYYADITEVRECIDWLKSLKDRVIPQSKQEWSKEDKERFISCLKRLGSGNPEQPETINSKWFKEHVFPQNRWMPSDEQMDSLEYIIDNIQHLPYSCSVAKELLEQLKKIKGE